MHKGLVLLSTVALATGLAACKKPDAEAQHTTAAATPASEPATVAPAPTPAEPATDAADDEARAKLDYATMEDGYINDADAQWAVAATASTAFGSANDAPVDSQDQNTAWQATGAVNGDNWTNNQQDIGFDWLQLDYERPVSATAVRAVLNEEAVESITRVELIATDGKAHTVWSGVSDTKEDQRGSRTWFVRTFEATPYPVKSVKLSFANNVSSGYKKVDAVQLVGK
jgi:hypothetical protein